MHIMCIRSQMMRVYDRLNSDHNTLFYNQQRIYMKISHHIFACSLLFFTSTMQAGTTERDQMKALIRRDFAKHGLEHFEAVADVAEKVVGIYCQKHLSSDVKQKQMQNALEECKKNYLKNPGATLKTDALKTAFILKRLQDQEQFLKRVGATPAIMIQSTMIQQNDFPYHIVANGIFDEGDGTYRNS